MFILGVTGPSGAGKGTVCEILKRYGFYHIDTDRLVPLAYEEAYDELLSAFGSGIFSDGKVNKKELAKAAFSSREKTDLLNSILHPRIMNQVRKEISEAEKDGFCAVAIDGAALIEANAQMLCDRMLCVLAPEEERISRVTARDSISEEAARQRFSAQKDDVYYSSHCGDTVINQDRNQLEHDLEQRIREWKYE